MAIRSLRLLKILLNVVKYGASKLILVVVFLLMPFRLFRNCIRLTIALKHEKWYFMRQMMKRNLKLEF